MEWNTVALLLEKSAEVCPQAHSVLCPTSELRGGPFLPHPGSGLAHSRAPTLTWCLEPCHPTVIVPYN